MSYRRFFNLNEKSLWPVERRASANRFLPGLAEGREPDSGARGEEKGMAEGITNRRDFLLATGGAAFALISCEQAGAKALLTAAPAEALDGFDVRRFGARGDGKALDTPAVNRAIEAAAAAGGGTVLVPAGTYLCYSIRLKSKIRLYLAHGATIVAADPPTAATDGYDLPESNKPWEDYQDFGHNHWRNSLIWGQGLENISICGPGRIWGRGLSRGEGAGPVAEKPGVGNKAIALKNCRDVLL
ncbi:MAG TPA: glycosyl hydrolase family 28-related protein, partial [Candidatus Bathyarchaeia archaeon]|nr:glycosyl hydrolase family 28-related protein [Candidatus Bathyarchaeia archaeon]